ncbi:MAG: hypothetical protein JW736_09115 [Deltaproteobacteria bacterium]|nr:hypothetical protein [Deltaproteobacteria bacterium]MBN2686621.1 hypothetical protein [Deltaproteobacteria bacterium]
MRIGVIVVAVTTAVFAANCGKKADPVCPRSIKPLAVSDVSARIRGLGIDVSWTVDQGERDDLTFRIFRSSLKPDGCLTCPREYNLIDHLSLQDPKLKRNAGNGLTYRDTEVAHGYSYSYKVVTCNESENCSDESNRADVVFP